MCEEVMNINDDYTLACLLTYHILYTDFFKMLAKDNIIRKQLNDAIEQSVQKNLEIVKHFKIQVRQELMENVLFQYVKYLSK